MGLCKWEGKQIDQSENKESRNAQETECNQTEEQDETFSDEPNLHTSQTWWLMAEFNRQPSD